MKQRDKHQNYQKYALLFLLLVLALAALCMGSLIFADKGDGKITARVYQNGQLIASIDLSDLKEPCTFTVTGENGCTNTVEARPGSIGILSASCPDRLCVKQGFIENSLLPVTCLPNRLVIEIHTDTDSRNGGERSPDPDTVTY